MIASLQRLFLPQIVSRTTDSMNGTPIFSKTNDGEMCIICQENNDDKSVVLNVCGHCFHKSCIEDWFNSKGQFKKCPSCRKAITKEIGFQPEHPDSYMRCERYSQCLPGHPEVGRLILTCCVPSGIQNATHPHPGRIYSGIRKKFLFPDNEEGRKLIELLRVAWEQKLLFRIEVTSKPNQNDHLVVNGFYLKTEWPEPDTSFVGILRMNLDDVGLIN